MKILHIADKRSDAELAAAALRSIGPQVAVLWASHFNEAAKWVQDNRDVAALVVDAQFGWQSCASFLAHVRRLGLNAPLVVVAPAVPGPVESFVAGADGYVAKSSLAQDLPAVVAQAIERRQTSSSQPSNATETTPAPALQAEPARDRGSRAAISQAHIDALLTTRDRLAQMLANSQAALERTERARASDAAATAERQARLEALVEQEQAARARLEQKLSQAAAELREADQRHASAVKIAAVQLALRQAQYEIGQARADATWEMVDEQLREAGLEVERARQHQAAAAANAERLSHRETELSLLLTEASANEHSLKARLADAEAALAASEQRAARDRLAAGEQAASRQAEFRSLLAEEVEKLRAVEAKLESAALARDEAEQRHATAMTDASALLAERQAQFAAEFGEATAARTALGQQARDLEAALGRARHELESSVETVERLARREAELSSMLADTAGACETLERRLSDTTAAFKEADERSTRERLAAARIAAEHQSELDGQIRHEREARATVEQKLADEADARREAERRHTVAMSNAALALAERQAQFEAELSNVAAARDRVERQLSNARAEVEAARREHAAAAAEAGRLTEREAELTSMVEAAAATRDALEHQLIQSAAALEAADERAASDRLTAASRELQLDARLRQEQGSRTVVEQRLADVERALGDEELRHASAVTAAGEKLAESRAQFESERSLMASAREQLERQLGDAQAAAAAARQEHASAMAEIDRLARLEAQLTSRLAEAAAVQGALVQRLADSAAAMKDREARAARERESAAARLSDVETRLTREIETREALACEVAETHTAAADAERWFREETAALVARAREHEAALEDQIARERFEHESQQAEMAERLQGLSLERDALAASLRTVQDEADRRNREHLEARELLERASVTADAEIRRLAAEHTETRRSLERASSDFQQTLGRLSDEQATAVARLAASVAERDAQIGQQSVQHAASLQTAEAERARQQEGFRVTIASLSGEIEQLQEKLATTLRELDDTRGRRDVLQIEADRASHLEDQLDESRTETRELQDRLAQAHRMEAVGRLASEVAVTCENLLSDVRRDVEQWLRTMDGDDAAARHQAGMLLAEVTRAAGFLRQLEAYGDEQADSLAPVDLNKVLRDLEPVLKRLAGNDVELELPTSPVPVHVDVKAERVERLLVNLASYVRERMPFGGQFKIEVATSVVDRKFIERFPNVRQGPHALLTVTEQRRAARTGDPLGLHDLPARSAAAGSGRPGVDLGALQALIRECGGHLWMTVEPPGDMMVKIHLPLRSSDEESRSRSVVRSSRGFAMARWFQH